MRGSVLDWLATAVMFVTVWLVLLVYDVVQRIARLFGLPAHQRAVCSMARNIDRAIRLAGVRMHFEGREHVVPGRSYVIVANHQSLFDITMSSHYLWMLRPRYIAKKELLRHIPGVSYNLRRGGSACIDRGDPRQAFGEIDRLAERIREDKWSVVIFPEGTRSKTGEMRPFQVAGLRALCARVPGVEILPVTVSGGSRLFTHGALPIVRGVTLSYRVHPPLAPPDPGDARAFGDFVRRVERIIRTALPAAEPQPVHVDDAG